MLGLWLDDPLSLGLGQAVVAAVVMVAVMLAARWRGIHLERETLVALGRGLVQVVLAGAVLGLLFRGTGWVAALVLGAMVVTATLISARRARHLPDALQISLAAIGLGAGLLIVPLVALGLIDPALPSLIPVGSMLVANSMNTNSLALERFHAEVASHAGQVEAALALGAAPETAVAPYAQASVEASLIPRLDTLRSLGIVWIPGVMAGMVLSGADPIYAALYQFVVIAMIFATSGLTALLATVLVRRRVFTSAHQLRLRRRTA